MRASERVGNQIVYLDYVLQGGADSVDAELLRPVWDNLTNLIADPALPGAVRSLAVQTASTVLDWLSRGQSLSRESLERIRKSLASVLTVLGLYAADGGLLTT